MPHLRKLAALVALSAIAVPVALAGAADPKPVPCNGLLLKDAAGDQDVAPVGGGGAGSPIASKGPDNIDIRGLFWNMSPGPDGKPVATANIPITDLTSEIPAEAYEGEVRYLVDFGSQGDVEWLRAVLKEDGWSFIYGKFNDLPDPLGGQVTEEPTKGQVWEGKDGIIQIEMPASAGIKDGTKMTDVITRVSIYNRFGIFVSDQAPDGGTADAVDFVIKDCPPPPATTGTGTGGGTGTGTGSGGGGGSAQGQPAPTPGQPGAGLLPVAGPLTVSAAVDRGKRSTARKRGLRARVRCSVQCRATAVATVDKRTARKLKLGRKATKIGTGKATILKPGRIPFYIKMTKKAKKALARKGAKKFKLTVAFRVADLQGKQVKKPRKRSTLR